MSAGICIMNKNAIALAADSAVTIGQHLAIHNSANKLFALSRRAAVGVIIYSNAELMCIPVEIILKQYKSELRDKVFPTLEDYVTDFLGFLITRKDLFHFTSNESSYVSDIYTDLLNGLNGDYQLSIKKKIEEVKRELTDSELKEIQKNVINSTVQFVDNFPVINNGDFYTYIKETYWDKIEEYIKIHFNWIDDSQINTLIDRVCLIYNKQFMRNGYVGLAFAGYGENNIFPQMIHLHISGMINNQLRYTVVDHTEITEDQPASIMPLAQTDVMQTFLFGINDSFIQEIGAELPQQIQKGVLDIADEYFVEGKKNIVQQELSAITSKIIEQIVRKAQMEYLFPITQSISTLPVSELALLAESMINITSLRRKVALDNNIGTVGGPIDVAIISKADGFIWLKRKHYFDRTYNPQYFYSHYMLSGREETSDE